MEILGESAVFMGSRLDEIKDWALLAKAARYNAEALARLCEISPRQLRRYFKSSGRGAPHEWLHALRMRRAVELICDETPVKETALELGYKDPAHFTHDFTTHFGVSPSKFASAQAGHQPQSTNVRF